MNSVCLFNDELKTIGAIPGVLYGELQPEEGDRKNFEGFIAGHAGFPFRKTAVDAINPDLLSETSNYVHSATIDDEPVNILDTQVHNWLLDGKPTLCTIMTEFGLDFDAMIEATWHSKRYLKALREAISKFGAEALGCYYPWHQQPKSDNRCWGIYLYLVPICGYAKLVSEHLVKAGLSLPNKGDYVEVAEELVLRHEKFHFNVERFAIAQEVIQRRPIYKPYDRNVFSRVSRTNCWLEEALAQASVLGSLETKPIKGLDGKVLREALTPLCEQMGAGYRDFSCQLFYGPSLAIKHLGSQIVTGQIKVQQALACDFSLGSIPLVHE